MLSLIIVSVSIKLAKRKNRSVIENQGPGFRNNQSKYNGDVAENIILGIICMFGLLSAILRELSIYFDMLEIEEVRAWSGMLSRYLHVFFAMTILPGLAVWSNAKIRKYMTE